MPGEQFSVGGFFTIECYDQHGNFKWKDRAKNGVTTAGLNHILNTEFNGGSAVATWYIGLIHDTNYSALAAADTMGSHAGWEESVAYDEATRVAWVEGAAASGVMTNGTASDFTISATIAIKGAFLTSVSTKGGTTGTLFCTALFSEGDRAVVDNDVLKVTYTLTATSA